MELRQIATFHSPLESKFGVPKQSGLASHLEGRVVFLPDFRNADALRGIEGFDYLWLIWAFSANPHQAASPVVRPPVLGGNERVGVFASRSPFRPNPIGLSSVRLDRVEWETPEGPVLYVKGADLMDGTPIYDIKPYLPYADCHAEAKAGFTDVRKWERLKVVFSEDAAGKLSEKERTEVGEVLSLDPRPRYHTDVMRVYGMPYAGRDVKFHTDGETLFVIDVV